MLTDFIMLRCVVTLAFHIPPHIITTGGGTKLSTRQQSFDLKYNIS